MLCSWKLGLSSSRSSLQSAQSHSFEWESTGPGRMSGKLGGCCSKGRGSKDSSAGVAYELVGVLGVHATSGASWLAADTSTHRPAGFFTCTIVTPILQPARFRFKLQKEYEAAQGTPLFHAIHHRVTRKSGRSELRCTATADGPVAGHITTPLWRCRWRYTLRAGIRKGLSSLSGSS